MTGLPQQLFNGLLSGGVYSLFAVGLTLSLGVLRVVNLAHGITMAISAIAAVKLAVDVDLPFPLLVVFGALIGGVIGLGLETIAFRPLRKGPEERNTEMASLVSSLAVLFMLQTVAQQWTDGEPLNVPSSVFQSHSIDLGPFTTRSIVLVAFLTTLVLIAGTWWVINRTQAGRAVRAVAMDEDAAAMMGVNAGLLKLLTTGASGALAGIAGVLIGTTLGAVSFTMGDDQLLRGFAVVILGGIGSIAGCLIGGMLVGLAEGLTLHFFGSGWQAAAPFVLLIACLLVRPQGLLGRELVDRA